jgi:hypothetical protein
VLPGPEEEAVKIVDALYDEVGATGGTLPHREVPPIIGIEALLEMKEAGFPAWAEVEWGGYYLKFLLQKLCGDVLSGVAEPLDLSHKRHFIKGDYVWDAHLSAEDKNEVPLGAVDEYADIIEANDGIGVLIADAYVQKDETGEFKHFQEDMKGGLSEYDIKAAMEGKPPQPRKEAFFIRKVYAYFFTPADLESGIQNRWAKNSFQRTMKNSNDSRRGGKYSIKIDSIPKEYLLFVKNFNEDAKEFGDEFPEFN